ncbi:MAG: dTDP-4-dehydrorhamnose 3,5-epimerase, partial [Saprospiraceae bacterium]|nr:dTDP-4-dehydrorhamnose 3,5-epimerase [Saprospiraceae bacterium]
MKFIPAHIKGLYTIDLQPFQDDRGFFSRIYCKEEFKRAGLVDEFVQVNHSVTLKKGTLRGLHYQIAPHAEVKVLRCVRGRIFDVVVDVRKGSPTFLQHFSIELSESNNKMLYIPTGLAHGFQTLVDNTAIIYQHSNFYDPGAERGIRYDDPLLSIDWPLS